MFSTFMVAPADAADAAPAQSSNGSQISTIKKFQLFSNLHLIFRQKLDMLISTPLNGTCIANIHLISSTVFNIQVQAPQGDH
ncbi:hypothetical protein FSARC_3115 [Fusarium sarcochroum]|uniref:Uncharacterized protein n=1 Tax=Fusarium sarcochroum TaxID=1208366 RepID=A0A8H4U524_9HYPO|nr:hypothetical protein FSARC_3115 [Fusarium sarcochroum]